ILVVCEDRNPFAMPVRRNALEAFEHFVAGDGQSGLGLIALGNKRAPGRMRMQYAPSVACANHSQMQKSFRGRLAFSFQNVRVLVDLQKILWGKRGFVESGGSDQQTQRPAAQYRAVIAAGAERPSARVEFAAERGKILGDGWTAARFR